jgi:hypothetical protein
MSLLMQALRKAERAKQGVQLTEAHDEGELQLAPLETDVQKAAAGSEERPVGGPAFSLEPLEPPSSPSADRIDANDDADIPVVAATEAMHDPVPPARVRRPRRALRRICRTGHARRAGQAPPALRVQACRVTAPARPLPARDGLPARSNPRAALTAQVAQPAQIRPLRVSGLACWAACCS